MVPILSQNTRKDGAPGTRNSDGRTPLKSFMFRTFCLTVIFVLASFVSMKLTSAQTPSSSAQAFVAEFYSWYGPQALQDHAEPTWRVALKTKEGHFDPLLVRLLQSDSAAQDKCEDLVGLDFDPFLNSQDPAQHYDVGEVKHEGDVYIAPVYSVQSGQRSSKPDVRASIERKNGRWMFVNFYYPSGGDLLTTLRAPRLPCSSPRPARKQ